MSVLPQISPVSLYLPVSLYSPVSLFFTAGSAARFPAGNTSQQRQQGQETQQYPKAAPAKPDPAAAAASPQLGHKNGHIQLTQLLGDLGTAGFTHHKPSWEGFFICWQRSDGNFSESLESFCPLHFPGHHLLCSVTSCWNQNFC